MSIYDKIEEIRQKPEHIRMRYVWACVIVSMVLVLSIWALSLKNRQYKAVISGEVAGEASIFDELKKQKESLGQYQQEMSNIKGNLQQELQNAQNQQDVPVQPSDSNPEGFEGGSAQNTIPAANPASLLQ